MGASRGGAGKAMFICRDPGKRRPLTTSRTQVPHLRTMATELCVQVAEPEGLVHVQSLPLGPAACSSVKKKKKKSIITHLLIELNKVL